MPAGFPAWYIVGVLVALLVLLPAFRRWSDHPDAGFYALIGALLAGVPVGLVADALFA